MKKKKPAIGRLSIASETIVMLDSRHQQQVAGGASNDHPNASCGCSGPGATQGNGSCVGTWCSACVTFWC